MKQKSHFYNNNTNNPRHGEAQNLTWKNSKQENDNDNE